MEIAERHIGKDQPPYIIAEMSGNHNSSLERALAIIDAAAAAGVDAVKIQTYTADTMTLDIDREEFFIPDSSTLWKGRSLYSLYDEAHTPWKWHQALFKRARGLGLTLFSTPFDNSSVEFLEELDAPCYKIASFENCDLPLIRRVAATGKPMLISTGMASVAELDETVRCARDGGCNQLVLLKCTSSYPATPENTNLATLPHLRDLFDCEVGVSDHTLGLGVGVAAVALGATVIEKHFTLSRADGGVDSAFSLEPDEMKNLVAEVRRGWQALGKISYGPNAQEQNSLVFRRSLYVTRDLVEGESLTGENVRAIRPGHGLAPKYLGEVLGMTVKRRVRRGTPLSWDILK